MKNYTFFSDPGHGWLRVLKSELISLGIDQEISFYSYENNGYVYLEEDSDAPKFCRAKGWNTPAQSERNVQSIHEDKTAIRNYRRYSRPYREIPQTRFVPVTKEQDESESDELLEELAAAAASVLSSLLSPSTTSSDETFSGGGGDFDGGGASGDF